MKLQPPISPWLACILLLLSCTQPLTAQTRPGGPALVSIDRYWRGVSRWYVEFDYGSGTINHLSSTSPFANPGLLELRAGLRDLKMVRRGILDSEEKFVGGKWYSPDFSAFKNASQTVRLNMFGFGLGSRTAYGYEWGSALFFPYHQYAFTFTKVQPAYSSSVPDVDRALMDRYKGPFRVGISFEGGFRFHVSGVLSFQTGVEGSVVYPRFVFPKWAGSYVVGAFAFILSSQATESILSSSPLLAPVFSFFVRNAISYLFYQAIRRNSFWPFRSEPPLSIATLKAGFAIRF
jgi:hypothetical protein